jgi:hypothetical protein
MSALAALAYADGRALANDVRRGLRSPGRIAMWLAYFAALGLFFWSRTLTIGRAGHNGGGGDLTRADYFVCALLATLFFSLATGWGAVGIFRTRAEARFIIGSPVAAPLAIAYLQARAALARGLRLLFSFVYFIFLFGPRQIGPAAVAVDIILVFAFVSTAAAVLVPRRLLARPAAIACAVVCAPLALLAIAPAIRDAVVRSPLPLPPALARPILGIIPPWHPGRGLLEPHPLWLLPVLGLAAVAIAFLASAGRDAYPELYALSIARIDRLERWQRRRENPAAPAVVVHAARHAIPDIPAPPGVLVFVWKSVVEFGRRTKREYIVGGGVLCCCAGFVAGRMTKANGEEFFAALGGVLINLILVIGIVGVTATNTIAAEIRRPLFWLARASLFERLCAIALARIWTIVGALELVALCFALGGGPATGAIFFALGLPVLVALLAALGFVTFALFPGPVDLRGPVTVLRLGLSGILLIPPFVLGVIVASMFHAALAGLLAAVLLAIIEAGSLIGVAAWRLDGHVDRLAV